MNDENQVMETPTGDAAGLSVTMDRTPWISFNRWSFATFEDWKSVCELAGVDPDNEDSHNSGYHQRGYYLCAHWVLPYRLSSHLFPLFVWSQIEKATQIIVMSVDVNSAMLFAHYMVC